MKVVFTNGCFDILHRGHIELLRYCKSLGTKVVVGLNSDDSVSRLKGDSRPYFSQEDRKFTLESLRYVDEVYIFDEDTPLRLIQNIIPDVIVKGGDYTPDTVVGNEVAHVEIFNFVDGYSTTNILEKMP
jgi:D-beta-D-heptose 7-phosphate kinase/D-beta-D-heptose 1-phosphate adenosyltransferase